MSPPATCRGCCSVEEVGEALTATTCATLEAALAIGVKVVEFETGKTLPTRMAVVSMGRLGGHEVGYGSDADVMFVHQPLPGADAQAAGRAAQAVALEMRKLLALPGGDPPLEVDAGLRPEGKQGALVRTLDSYAAYYAKWSAAWEAQALLRAEAVVGDRSCASSSWRSSTRCATRSAGSRPPTCARCVASRPGWTTSGCRAAPTPPPTSSWAAAGSATSSGPSSCCRCATPGTTPSCGPPAPWRGSSRLAGCGLLTSDEAATLTDTWRLVSRIRNAITLVRGKSSDQLPRDVREMTALAFALGYPAGESDELTNDYLRASRRARSVVDEVFWNDRSPS